MVKFDCMETIPTQRRPPTPGEILVEDFLMPRCIPQVTFALETGISLEELGQIVRGERALTFDIAVRFSQALGTSSTLWLKLQEAVEAYDACQVRDLA
jgi:antitoxin HigA-1